MDSFIHNDSPWKVKVYKNPLDLNCNRRRSSFATINKSVSSIHQQQRTVLKENYAKNECNNNQISGDDEQLEQVMDINWNLQQAKPIVDDSDEALSRKMQTTLTLLSRRYLDNLADILSPQQKVPKHKKDLLGKLGDYVDCPADKENDTTLIINKDTKIGEPKNIGNKAGSGNVVKTPIETKHQGTETEKSSKQIMKPDPILQRINKDLNSPSASTRMRAIKALKEPLKSSYAHFDIPEAEQTLLIPHNDPSNLHDIMRNIIVYVEVRSGEDNRSAGVRKVIASMGARVNLTLLRDTTHVIFKDGLLSTYKKAKQWGIPVVSILWIEACKIKRRICDPKDYPISNLDRYENPELYTKMKRTKYMQPDSECNKRVRLKTAGACCSTPNDGGSSTPTERTNATRKLTSSNNVTPKSSISKRRTDISQYFHKLHGENDATVKRNQNTSIKSINQIHSTCNTPQKQHEQKASKRSLSGSIRNNCDASKTDTTDLTLTDSDQNQTADITVEKEGASETLNAVNLENGTVDETTTPTNLITENECNSVLMTNALEVNTNTIEENMVSNSNSSIKKTHPNSSINLTKSNESTAGEKRPNINTAAVYSSKTPNRNNNRLSFKSETKIVKKTVNTRRSISHPNTSTQRYSEQKTDPSEQTENNNSKLNSTNCSQSSITTNRAKRTYKRSSKRRRTVHSTLSMDETKLTTLRGLASLEKDSISIIDKNCNIFISKSAVARLSSFADNSTAQTICLNETINESYPPDMEKSKVKYSTSKRLSGGKVALNISLEENQPAGKDNCDDTTIATTTSIAANNEGPTDDKSTWNEAVQAAKKLVENSILNETNTSPINLNPSDLDATINPVNNKTASPSATPSSEQALKIASLTPIQVDITGGICLTSTYHSMNKNMLCSTRLDAPECSHTAKNPSVSLAPTTAERIKNSSQFEVQPITDRPLMILSTPNRRRTIFDASMDIITHNIERINLKSSRRSLQLCNSDETIVKSSDTSVHSMSKVHENDAPSKIHSSPKATNTPLITPKSLGVTSVVISTNKKRKLFPGNEVTTQSTYHQLPAISENTPTNTNKKTANELKNSTSKSRRRTLMPLAAGIAEEINDSARTITITTKTSKSRRSTLDFEPIKPVKSKTVATKTINGRTNTKSSKNPPTTTNNSNNNINNRKTNNINNNNNSRKSSGDCLQNNGEGKLGVIVCTNMQTAEIDLLRETVKQLGGFEFGYNVCETTTHLVSYDNRRTMNLLRGLIRGIWIVHYRWITESRKAGRWLPPEIFELRSFSKAVPICRSEREAFGSLYKCELFSSMGSFYISSRCEPISRESIRELVTMCGGRLAQTRERARFIIGDPKTQLLNKLSMSPFWILDSIKEMQLMKFDKYIYPKVPQATTSTGENPNDDNSTNNNKQ